MKTQDIIREITAILILLFITYSFCKPANIDSQNIQTVGPEVNHPKKDKYWFPNPNKSRYLRAKTTNH